MINDYLKKSASVWKFSLPNLDIKPSPIQLREPFQDNKIGENHFLGSWAPGAEISKKGGGLLNPPSSPHIEKVGSEPAMKRVKTVCFEKIG